MRLRIPHPVQTWFTSISGTSKRNPLLHRSDQTTADVSAPVQSNPAVLEAIQDLCYEIFAIPVATTEAVHIAQAVCGHIYEFSQSSQPPLQQLAMEMLPTLVHVYLVMLAVVMRLRIPHPVQTWFTSISGTSKRNPLLHRSDQTTADVSAPVQSNPAVLEAIQDLCYEIFAIPVATTEAVHIAQAVCGHIYEFSQSSQPPLQQLAMEMLPTLVHVYLVMLANSGREEFALGVSKTRRPPDADSKPLHRSRAQEAPLDESLTSSKVRKSFRSRVSNLASKQSSNLLRGHQIMRQRTRKMFAGLSPQPVFRHKQQQQQPQQPAGQVQQSPAVTTTTAEAAEVVPASTVSLLGGLPAFAANLAALSAILEACLLSLYNAYALRQPAVPQSRSADGIPAALFGGSVFSAAIPTPAAVTATNMLSPRVRTDLTSGSILLPTPTERLLMQSSSIGSSSSPSPLPPPLPSLADCQPSIVSSISSRGEQDEQDIHLARVSLASAVSSVSVAAVAAHLRDFPAF
ncbi:hypothetical protein SprV_0200681500 [Sparganum proliferum]